MIRPQQRSPQQTKYFLSFIIWHCRHQRRWLTSYLVIPLHIHSAVCLLYAGYLQMLSLLVLVVCKPFWPQDGQQIKKTERVGISTAHDVCLQANMYVLYATVDVWYQATRPPIEWPTDTDWALTTINLSSKAHKLYWTPWEKNAVGRSVTYETQTS